ncbi:EscE/YscE/SsaE family type III secretion system needle protein co-chaperone [Pseudomonas sp. MWU13-3659]|uniref:EscE/YscE/SsaE family type III secretion system needle protein co-chaperone n=1 Tax=Pseudomonas sp. MWU13-3659 TaxID=2986964 RepID=UPI002075F83A|nr:EscE/YscE/SsaE family type III secretion system needle protein co-chaperone [Pseudomonas sp. MWU13-3659]
MMDELWQETQELADRKQIRGTLEQALKGCDREMMTLMAPHAFTKLQTKRLALTAAMLILDTMEGY